MSAAQKELARANHLLDAGYPIEAGDVFVRISRLGEQYNQPIQAANLAARATHAYLLGEAIDQATTQARRAIRLKLQAGSAVRMAQRILEEMELYGYVVEAQALRSEFDNTLKKMELSEAQQAEPTEVKKARLPAQCPACLGPVRSDEVEWIDENSARCSFCSSTLKAE